MKKIRPNKFYYDEETTGFSLNGDQILEFAVVVRSPDRKTLEVFERKVKLKDGIIPSPNALLVNNINPYSKEWNDEAITEHQLMLDIAALAERHTNEGGKPIPVAYNGSKFDLPRLEAAGKRTFVKVMERLNQSSRDPLLTVNRLIKSNVLKTKEYYDHRSGEVKSSKKQTDVAEALNVKYKGEAHRSLADVWALVEIDEKLEDLILEAHENKYIALPDKYDEGQVVRVATDSKGSGRKERHLYVLHNDLEKETIWAVDEDDLKANKKLVNSSIRQFKYATIEKELRVSENEEKSLRDLVGLKKNEIKSLLDAKIAKEYEDKESGWHRFCDDFNVIHSVRQRLISANGAIAKEVFKIKSELEQSGVDYQSIKEILNKANDLHLSQGGKSLFRPIAKPCHKDNLMIDNASVTITTHPTGYYAVEISKENAQGKPVIEKKKIRSQLELSRYLSESLNKSTPEINEYLKAVPSKEEFTDGKHPLSLIEEWKESSTVLYSDETPQDVKDGISGILKDIYRVYPEVSGTTAEAPLAIENVKDHRVFETPEIKSARIEESDGNVPIEPLVAKVISKGTTPANVDKKQSGSVKCAVCGRPIKSEKAVMYVMGSVCRSRLMMFENGLVSVSANSSVKWSRMTDKVISNGGIFIVKLDSDETGVYSINNQVSIPGKVRLIDRKKLSNSLASGLSLEDSLLVSTMDVEKRLIKGIARIEVEPDAHKREIFKEISKKESTRVVLNELPLEYDKIFDEMKSIYDTAIKYRQQGREDKVNDQLAKADKVSLGFVTKIMEKYNYRPLKIELKQFANRANELLFYDKKDMKTFLELVENGNHIDSQYLKMKNVKGDTFVFPNMKYKGYEIEKIGYGKPDHFEDDPFGPWDREYGVSAKRLQFLSAKNKKIEIHTSSPRVADEMYANYIPLTSKIFIYLREPGRDEQIYQGNEKIKNAANALINRGHDVVIIKPKGSSNG